MANDEIQVGEYVKTKEGYIAKCTYKDKGILEFDNVVRTSCGAHLKFLFPSGDTGIINHSFNPIDLIEVGDYVNGHLVVGFNEEVDINGYKYKEIEIESDHLINHCLKLEDIKLIVTKGQFKSMEYKVE